MTNRVSGGRGTSDAAYAAALVWRARRPRECTAAPSHPPARPASRTRAVDVDADPEAEAAGLERAHPAPPHRAGLAPGGLDRQVGRAARSPWHTWAQAVAPWASKASAAERSRDRAAVTSPSAAASRPSVRSTDPKTPPAKP